MPNPIDEMKAGPDLDRLACEAVGIEPVRRGCYCDGQWCRSPHYCDAMVYPAVSTKLAAAIRIMGEKPGMTLMYGVARDGEWLAKTAFPYTDAVADTPALAIARAVAKTKGGER